MDCVLSPRTEYKHASTQAFLETQKASQNEALTQSPKDPSPHYGFYIFLVALVGLALHNGQCNKETRDLELTLVCILELGGWIPHEVFSNTPYLTEK